MANTGCVGPERRESPTASCVATRIVAGGWRRLIRIP